MSTRSIPVLILLLAAGDVPPALAAPPIPFGSKAPTSGHERSMEVMTSDLRWPVKRRRDEIQNKHEEVEARRDALGRRDRDRSTADAIIRDLESQRSEHDEHLALIDDRGYGFHLNFFRKLLVTDQTKYDARLEKEKDDYRTLKGRANRYLSKTKDRLARLESRRGAQASRALTRARDDLDAALQKVSDQERQLSAKQRWYQSVVNRHGLGGIHARRQPGYRERRQKFLECGGDSRLLSFLPDSRVPAVALDRELQQEARILRSWVATERKTLTSTSTTQLKAAKKLATIKLGETRPRVEALLDRVQKMVEGTLRPLWECTGAETSDLLDDDSVDDWMTRDLAAVTRMTQFQKGVKVLGVRIQTTIAQIQATMGGSRFTAAARARTRAGLTTKLRAYRTRLTEISAAMARL